MGNRQYDTLFTMDGLNRLTVADEGTISNRSRKQEWTLSQPGLSTGPSPSTS